MIPRPTRTCGECTACCWVFPIDTLEKPAGTWCRSCAPGRGCQVHAVRPIVCQEYTCLWLDGMFGPHDRPDYLGAVFTAKTSLVGETYVEVRRWRGSGAPTRQMLLRMAQILKTGVNVRYYPSPREPQYTEGQPVLFDATVYNGATRRRRAAPAPEPPAPSEEESPCSTPRPPRQS
jgi:hypothetical protein